MTRWARCRWRALALLLAVQVLWRAPPALGEPAGRRWLVVVGENAGVAGEERLRYAEDDARRVLEVMLEVGGVERQDAVALYGARAEDVRAALSRTRARLRGEATLRDQLFVYVSSHADEGALHLDGSSLPLAELHAFLQEAPVSVGVLVVDSCRSGAITQLKGLSPVRAPVRVGAAEVQGRVLIGSSGADEYAQESEALQGSYFTHHWMAGLRGAADSSRDGRVSLQEAYSYAYVRTLESTFGTRGGLQTPSYRWELRGHGDLVLTELSRASAQLHLEVEAPGQWQVLSSDTGALVAQLEKGTGGARLAVAPGRYRVRTRIDGGQLEQRVEVSLGGAGVVRAEELRWTPLPRVARKGGGLLMTGSVGPAAASSIVAGVPAVLGAEVRVHWRRERWVGPLDTVSSSVGFRTGRGRQVVPFHHHEVELRVGLGRTLDFGRFALALGPELGALLAVQANTPGAPSRLGLAGSLGVAVDARVRVRRGWGFFLAGTGAAVLTRKVDGVFPVPRVGAALGVVFEL